MALWRDEGEQALLRPVCQMVRKSRWLMTAGGRFPGTRLEWTQGTKLMHIRVPRSEWDALHVEAKRRGIGIGAMVRLVVRAWCEEVTGGSD